MKVRFEELSAPKRAGGIDAACTSLTERLRSRNILVDRSSDNADVSQADLPDCVHFHGLWSPNLARQFLFWRERSIPCVISCHGMLTPWALSHKSWRKSIAWHVYQKRILNNSDALHATSKSEASQLLALGLKSKICVIPWGIQTETTSLKPTKSASEKYAIFVGRLCPIKGLPMLFEAWHQIQPNGWKLRIIGPDEAGYKSHCESLVNMYGINQNVSFEGELRGNELREAFVNAELFILPSHSENFSLVVGEALSHGVPVITTNGTPWNRIAEVEAGWWVQPTVSAIKEALFIATQTDMATLRKMGETGRELVAREYSWELVTDSFVDLYSSLSNSAI